MTNKVFSLLNYIGHKSKIVDQILSHFPKTIDGRMYDLFSGSCVVGLSTDYNNVTFVDNNAHLQNLYSYLQDKKFLSILESMIDKYNMTNSSKKPRSEYLKDPNIGTCVWHGKVVSNMHLDQLNVAGYNSLMLDYNAGKFKGISKACAYMILTLYGRNSSVGIKKDGNLSGAVGPLDFSIRAKKKFENHQKIMKNRNLHFTTGIYKDAGPLAEDFVYMDPPYLASGFRYGGWTEQDEKDLLAWIDILPCQWALSNVFISGNTKNKVLFDWAQSKNIIYINKKYRKWSTKGKSTAQRQNKKNEEVLILPK